LLFNKAQDIVLDKRFGKDTYEDDEEVLGTETTISPTVRYQQPTATRAPSPTPQPTSSGSNTTNNSPTNTPVPPTAVPPTNTPLPTPTTPPPQIKGASDITQPSRTSALVTISIDGQDLDTVVSVTMTAIRTQDPPIGATTIDSKTNNNITASFDGIQCTPYTVTVTTLGGSATTGVNITSRC
jgi:hypothetical protein